MIVNHNNIKYDLTIEQDTIDSNIFYDIFDKDELHFIELNNLVINKDNFVIDIGAHIGASTILIAKLFDCNIIAIEPELNNFNKLQINTKVNCTNKITNLNMAVNYSKKNLILKQHPNHSTITVLVDQSNSDISDIEKIFNTNYNIKNIPKSITLEEIISQHDINSIDLLKIDCEGSEKDIFENITPNTCSKIKTIIGEYHFDVNLFTQIISKKFPDKKCTCWGTKQLGIFHII